VKQKQARTPSDAVARRAKLYDKAPVKEIIRRGWIEASPDLGVLEHRVLRFFGISNLDQEPTPFPHAARKSTSYRAVTVPQYAWLLRARALAPAVSAAPYSRDRFRTGLENLRALLADVDEVRRVPATLAAAGVRLVVVEHLAGTRLDGAAFWLDAASPVIALSLRYDRIDWFWHTLIHDAMHVLHEDASPKQGPAVDIDLVGQDAVGPSDKPPHERRADKEAAEFLVPQDQLEGFISRVRPLYSRNNILGFATKIGVHPGLVVGQLQRRGEIPYSHSRDLLQKVRNAVCESALTDGWGYRPPVGM
jgi:HTH-type transcriptional regulator/antitoxin HigA